MAAPQDVLFAAYADLLERPELFRSAVRELARGGESDGGMLRGLLLLLDMVFEVLAEVGMRNLLEVYQAVKRQPALPFASSSCWHACHLSGVSARGSTQLAERVFVGPQYTKWVSCLWLATHMQEQERGRADALPPAHAETYRKALVFVLAQVQDVYASTSAAQKNKVLAALPGPVAPEP